jgi:hypothetical protein
MTSKRIDQEYPHQVEIAIPEAGLGTRLHDMHDFCRERGFQYATRGKLRRSEKRDVMRYCFCNAGDAESFQAVFGGERVALPVKKPPGQSFGGRGLWSKRRT